MKQLLAFILLSTLTAWLMLAPVYRHVLMLRQALLQKEVDYLLEVGASGSYGYIDGAMVAQSRKRLGERGFDSDKLRYAVSTTSGTDGTDPARPVPRGVGIRLEIRYPEEGLSLVDRLIGVSVPGDGEIGAAGVKMSEYVP